MAFWVYILASDRNGTLYTGHTDDLTHRIWEHRTQQRRGFTSKYNVGKLVWFEQHPTRDAAKTRELRLKKWNRLWKLHLIEDRNPEWRDLYLDINNWYSPHSR